MGERVVRVTIPLLESFLRGQLRCVQETTAPLDLQIRKIWPRRDLDVIDFLCASDEWSPATTDPPPLFDPICTPKECA